MGQVQQAVADTGGLAVRSHIRQAQSQHGHGPVHTHPQAGFRGAQQFAVCVKFIGFEYQRTAILLALVMGQIRCRSVGTPLAGKQPRPQGRLQLQLFAAAVAASRQQPSTLQKKLLVLNIGTGPGLAA